MSRANTRFAPASSTSATGNDIYYSGQGGAGGELYFNGQYTSLLNTPAIGNGGADFIMGLPEFLSIGQNVGTRGTGIIRGPGMTEADLGVSKIFQITYGIALHWLGTRAKRLHPPQLRQVSRRQAFR